MGTGVSPKRISTRKVLSSILVSLDLKTKQYIKPSPLTLDSIRLRQVFGWAFTLNSVQTSEGMAYIINHFYSICGFQGTYLMYVRSTKLEKTSLSFANGLSANGDGEIRTLDPLLARQVLSQLSYTPIGCGSSFLFFKKQSLYSFV